jgi:hypothetical protein
MDSLTYLVRLGQQSEHHPSWPSYREKSILEAAILEACEAFQVSKEMATFAALGAISVACQGLIEIEQPTGNKVPGSLMLLVIAESGERKTTILEHFFKSVRRFQKLEMEKYQEAYKEYESSLHTWKIHLSVLESDLKKEIKEIIESDDFEDAFESGKINKKKKIIENHKSSCPVKPTLPKFIYEDSTPEALLKGMSNNSAAACLLSSEGGGVFEGRVMKDLSSINSLWDGGEVTVDRATSDCFILRNARLTTLLMAQGSVINRFMDKRGDEARGNGFLARMLVVKPEGMAGKRISKKASNLPRSEAFNVNIYNNIQKNSIFYDKHATNEKICLKFTENASEKWNDFYRNVESQMGKGCVYEYYKDHASKLMDNASRIAGLISYFEKGGDEDIDSRTLEYAIEIVLVSSYYFLNYLADVPEVVTNSEILVRYLFRRIDEAEAKAKAKDVYQCADSQNSDIIRIGKSLEFNWADVSQKGPSVLRNKKKFEEVIGILCKIGHVKIKDDNGSLQRRGFLFSETIINHESGKVDLENGKSIFVRNLPRFDQQYYGSPKKKESENETDLTPAHNGTSENRYPKCFYIICNQYDV